MNANRNRVAPQQTRQQLMALGAYGPQVQQPGQQQAPIMQFMPAPQQDPNVPPGLEYLTQIDQILIHEKVQLMEVFTEYQAANQYHVLNSMGQQVYTASEESGMCARQCCSAKRGFVMHITDNFGREVIRAVREFKCCACCNCCACCDCCAMELTVEAPPGALVGRIIQQRSCCGPKYEVQDGYGNTAFTIEGPMCICYGCWTQDQEFLVKSIDGSQEVGKISKQWSGFLQEMFTDATNFGVSFPVDLDVRMKATLLGAVFLIDFMFFEGNRTDSFNRQNEAGMMDGPGNVGLGGGGFNGGGFGGGFGVDGGAGNFNAGF